MFSYELCEIFNSIYFIEQTGILLLKKIKCLVCRSVFSGDYRLNHNSTNNQDFVQSNKNVPYEISGAPKNPSELRNQKIKRQRRHK